MLRRGHLTAAHREERLAEAARLLLPARLARLTVPVPEHRRDRGLSDAWKWPGSQPTFHQVLDGTPRLTFHIGAETGTAPIASNS